MVNPTASQIAIRDTEAKDLLVVAPAGCGKTEALALRIQGILARGDVAAPKKVLVVTFSNRARDNIRDRLRQYLPDATMRDRVSITNFHGLAARLIRAHANVIGLDPELLLPDSDWVGDQCREQGLDFKPAAAIQKILREAKQERRTDDEVDAAIQATGSALALSMERQRVAAGRLTYDDLPRLAELILADTRVQELYAAHFGAVVVDEFQDLTPQQLRIVNSIGLKRTTFAGDLAQGIYGFAGAKPAEVHAAISAECSAVIEFSESHRSSPAVLGIVNALAPLTGGTALTCADPASWPGSGLAALASFDTAEVEADWVRKVAAAIVKRAPNHRIGIIARTTGRRRFVEAALNDANLDFYRWDDGVLDTDTARIMKSMLAGFDLVGYNKASDPAEYLRDVSGFEAVVDPSGRENLVDALTWCDDLLRAGELPGDIRSRIRVGDANTLITEPGIHLLTGHVGKGQQFDWVLIVGLEDGVLPDFRADTPEALTEEARVLSVMASRARHGVVLTRASSVLTNRGRPMDRSPSRFIPQIQTASPVDASGLVAWFKAQDWDALTTR